MRKVTILVLLALELAVCGCGHSSSTTTTTTTNNWEAQLTGGTGEASLLNFVTAFTVTSTGNGPLSVTGFGFINTGKCFVSGETESGSSTLTVNSTNQVTGTMTYTVTSGTPSGNTLTLNGNLTGTSSGTSGTLGTLSGGVVAGTWTLTGGAGDSSCQGGGNFVMCQNAATCTVP